MENHYKIIKEKSNKIKLNNKKSITTKNAYYNTKISNKTNNKKNNKITNYNNSYIKNKNFLIFKNLQKYNTTITKYNVYITNAIIFDQRNHIVTVFKNYLLWDETSEFLKRYYKKKDNVERLPKIAEYYEQYTLYTPNYFGHEGLIILIMLKFIKRKNKYLKYLEEKEEEEEKNKNKNKKGIKKDFVPLLENEIKSLANTKSKSQYSSSVDITKNTLELTNYENDSIYINLKKKDSKNIMISEKNKIKINKDINNEKSIKNSISFTEIFDDLSSNFSVLINNNNYKDYKHKDKKIPVKSYTNRAYLIKKEKENNSKSSLKKLNLKKNNKKSISKKHTPNKQINESKNESNNLKYKEIYKISNFKKKINVMKKITSIKDNKFALDKEKEKEKNNEANKEEKITNIYNSDIKRAQRLSNNIISKKDKDKERDSNFSKIISNKKNLNIINNNNNNINVNKIIKNDVKINVMNTITDIKSHYYSLGKLKKNKKQKSAIKNVNIKSLNLVNLNQNVIPNLKKLVHNKKEKRIIFPRNVNCIFNNNSNNNSNKLNSMKIEKIEHSKLLTDKDKENLTLVNNTSESSKLIKFNDNIFFNYNQISSNNIINQHISHKVDLFAQKMGKLIKKKNISLIGDNLSSKDINSKNIILERNDKNENNISNNANNMNHMHYKKNSVLRQFNSKKDFNFNADKNNLFYNYNNISNNSINSSSSSSLNNLNRKRYKISSNQISYNNSITKNRKSLQKINLNLNLQINFNINIDKKKNKQLILGHRLSNRIFNEVNNKNNNNKYKNNKGNISNSNNNNNNNISVPLTQRCYYNINNKCHKFLGNYRSSSSSNSKNKQKGKNNL